MKWQISKLRRVKSTKRTRTFLDFFCSPVAQILRQHFSHVALLRVHLYHLQARLIGWKKKETEDERSNNRATNYLKKKKHLYYFLFCPSCPVVLHLLPRAQASSLPKKPPPMIVMDLMFLETLSNDLKSSICGGEQNLYQSHSFLVRELYVTVTLWVC